ncbi:MAG: nitroreductase family protein [Clostridiales bacterium]|nr:nitroreductase family protein [Clostridiales bacterium]
MDLTEAMKSRHSVRSYDERPIDGKVKSELEDFIDKCNNESGLHMQLVLNEPKAFSGPMAHYGKFSGVRNYIALIGKKGGDLQEKCGYYGEKVVLKAQQLGLNTCWVAMSYSKASAAYQIDRGEKLCVVIAIGYGTTQGIAHKSKPRESVMNSDGSVPAWFEAGIDAALLAPTAMNQQKFVFSLDGKTVSAKAGMGFYTKLDLGIVKYHFEIGAGVDNFKWK